VRLVFIQLVFAQCAVVGTLSEVMNARLDTLVNPKLGYPQSRLGVETTAEWVEQTI
jgi:hypothetical protein